MNRGKRKRESDSKEEKRRKDRERKKYQRSQESPECRAQRLEKLSHRQKQRLLEESPEHRSARLLSYSGRHFKIRRGSQATTTRSRRRGLPRSTSQALTGTTPFVCHGERPADGGRPTHTPHDHDPTVTTSPTQTQDHHRTPSWDTELRATVGLHDSGEAATSDGPPTPATRGRGRRPSTRADFPSPLPSSDPAEDANAPTNFRDNRARPYYPVRPPSRGEGRVRAATNRRPDRGRPRGGSRCGDRANAAGRGRGPRGRVSWLNIVRLLEMDGFSEYDIPKLFKTRFEGLLGQDGNVCRHCSADRWPGERKGWCCLGGTVQLPRLPPPLEQLLPLYTLRGSVFLKNARAYNNIFALASLGCNKIRQPGFIPTFTVQGKVYLPSTERNPSFVQLYFHDTEVRRGDEWDMVMHSRRLLQQYAAIYRKIY